MSAPDRYLAVGRVRRPHGVRGEVTVEVVTDFPGRVADGVEVKLGREGPDRRLTVHRVRMHKGQWLLAFEGLQDRDDVEPLRDLWLFLPEQERSELPPTYYYEHELPGLACVDKAGNTLGTVLELMTVTARPLLRVEVRGKEALVPFTSPIVVRVDLAAGQVVLDPPRGLLDGDAL